MFTLLQSGDDSCGVPPVPIPNTVVKPTYAESTWLETAWEDREPPVKRSDMITRKKFLDSSAGRAIGC